VSATVTIARWKDNLMAIQIDDVVKGMNKEFKRSGCYIELTAVKGDHEDHRLGIREAFSTSAEYVI